MHAGGVADNHGAWLDEKDPLEVRINTFIKHLTHFTMDNWAHRNLTKPIRAQMLQWADLT